MGVVRTCFEIAVGEFCDFFVEPTCSEGDLVVSITARHNYVRASVCVSVRLN